MIYAIAIVAAVIVIPVALYAYRKHLSVLAEVSSILASIDAQVRAKNRVPPAAPVITPVAASADAPKVEQP